MDTDLLKSATQLPKNADARLLKATNIFYFGKYKGKNKTVAEVIEEDPSYILWAQNNVAFIKFDESVLTTARENTTRGEKITFTFSKAELEEHADNINSLARGLDTYPNNGVREVHGVDKDVNLHKSLDYFRKLSRYVLQEIRPGGKLDNGTPGN